MRSMRFSLSVVQQVILCVIVAAGYATVTAGAQTIHNNGTGTNQGFFYSLYTSGGSSTMTFSTQYAGNYAISWSGVNDMVGGKGWNPGGYRTVGYNVGAANGYNNISVYGWTTNPLVEYYICEFGSLYTAECNVQGQCLQRWAHIQHVRASSSQPTLHHRHCNF